MTMALSSRLTRVRARWRAGRPLDGHSRESGVKSVRRSGSGGQAAPLGAAARLLLPQGQARRDMSGDRGENAMCDQLSLSS